MDATMLALVEQLGDPKSAKRRSAARNIRRSGDPRAGPAVLEALRREVGDRRTWETQYQMIMALGHCLHRDATAFLEALAEEGRVEAVQTAIGDALFRLSGGVDGDLGKAIEFIERGDPELVHGAFQAMAVERVVPADLNQARRVLEYGCSLRFGENNSAIMWLLRTVPGWPPEMVEPLLDHWGTVAFRDHQQIHGGVELARQRKYYKWSPL